MPLMGPNHMTRPRTLSIAVSEAAKPLGCVSVELCDGSLDDLIDGRGSAKICDKADIREPRILVLTNALLASTAFITSHVTDLVA
jgi:hypothetical protein